MFCCILPDALGSEALPAAFQMGQRLLDALAWEPERGTRFLVFDRRRGGAGLVATYK